MCLWGFEGFGSLFLSLFFVSALSSSLGWWGGFPRFQLRIRSLQLVYDIVRYSYAFGGVVGGG